ncbi:MAG: response regulator [Phycisphaerae bacterium]|nr:response regulator [Phycisphaerae bacterium]
MDATAAHPKILFLSKPDCDNSVVMPRLLSDAQVRVVTTFDEAMAALREESYDLVVSETSDFLALERATVNQQAAMILETIGQGVCIVDSGGQLVWANPKMRSYPDDLTSQVSNVCARTFGKPSDQEKGQPAHHRARRFSLTAGDDQYFEVTITPVLSSKDEITHISAVVWDVTHSRRLQKKIDAIDLAGRELVRLDAETMSGMNAEERIGLLEHKILRYMHDLLEFDNFAVLLLDKRTNRLEMVLDHGMSDNSHELDIFASPENNGISGYVASTGRSYICHDTSKDPRYLPGLESARSSLTVPLRLHDKIIGVFNIESEQRAAFNEDDRQFAEILARYVAITMNFLDLLITERYESTGRVANDVSGEIAGPLNDIITEASTLMEEYIGHDDLRHRLSAICDHVTEIKKTVKEVAMPQGGLLGSRGVLAKDPALDGKRVLVADDEEIIRETVGGVLRKAGCEVETACDGAQAIAMLEQRPYDLLVADIKMPVKNGYEVFAAARDACQSTAVILMTGFGYDPNHSIVRARRQGLNAVLFKPFKVDQLLSEVREALQAK